MKPKSIYFIFLSLLIFLISACKKNEVITGIKIDNASCVLRINETKQLNVSAFPSNKDYGLITWSSSKSEIVKVDENGVVEGIKKGEAIVYASLGSFITECKVTVIDEHVLPVSLTGSNYFLISMDNFSAAAVFDKITADYRPNEIHNNMFIWQDTIKQISTYLPGVYNGLNAYGEEMPWVSLVVNNAGWSGARFYSNDTLKLDKLSEITSNLNDYYLHIAIRDTTNTVYMFGLFDNNNYRFAVGSSTFNDLGDIIPNIADFTRDGNWQELNIPMSTFASGGFNYTHAKGGINVFWMLTGGVAGTNVEIDAVFIYKKP